MNKKLASLSVSALVMVVGAALTGCHGPGGTGGGGGGGPYRQPWYDVYGNYCGSGSPMAGCNFYADGTKIIDTEDPYYGTNNEFYYGTWDYVDSYGYYQSYYGWAWLSTSGILYDDLGNALNEEGEEESLDLIGKVAEKEKQVVTAAGKQFASRFALAEATGVSIAKTLNDWATLSKKEKRSRTEQDIADFSQRLYGVSLDKTKIALDSAKKGDFSAIERVNADVATYWGTSPETSKAILKGWYKQQLAEYGIGQ